jgi:hypothetical protein
MQAHSRPDQTQPKDQVLFWSESLVWLQDRECILRIARMQEEGWQSRHRVMLQQISWLQ